MEKAQITNNENIKTASLVFLLNSLILKIENNKKDDFINIENELNNIAEQQSNILKSHIKNVFDPKLLKKSFVLKSAVNPVGINNAFITLSI